MWVRNRISAFHRIQVSGYSGGLSYTFDTYTTTVDFGNGIVSGPTSVDIVDAASQSAFASFAARDGVVGILGIGTEFRLGGDLIR